jgi:hypothetical protein
VCTQRGDKKAKVDLPRGRKNAPGAHPRKPLISGDLTLHIGGKSRFNRETRQENGHNSGIRR